jgi:hypothetical protein
MATREAQGQVLNGNQVEFSELGLNKTEVQDP